MLAGEAIEFSGNGNANAGEINLLGGTVEFTRHLNNTATGFIGGNGTVIANGGLSNVGVMAFSGVANVFGDVNNVAGGQIVVSGNSIMTFFDDVVHNGAEIRAGAGSAAVYFGAVSGAGPYTGTGTHYFEGDLRPGNSPALVTVAGNMVLSTGSTTTMELGGLIRGDEYDAYDVGLTLTLGGELNAVYFNGFDATAGDVFDLFYAESINGSFTVVDLTGLCGASAWQLDLIADFNGNIDVLRLSAASAVPLPPAVWLFGSAMLGLSNVRRRNVK